MDPDFKRPLDVLAEKKAGEFIERLRKEREDHYQLLLKKHGLLPSRSYTPEELEALEAEIERLYSEGIARFFKEITDVLCPPSEEED